MPSPAHDAIVEMLRAGGVFAAEGQALNVPRLRAEMESMAAMSVADRIRSDG